MTAEIAILNREAVALAADSAVTINTSSGRKIYNTVNKLFALSKRAPVGIMVYGRAEMMGIPWESIIKVYRTDLGATKLDSLESYVEHFLRFFRRSRELFSAESQVRYFRDLAVSTLLRLRAHALTRIEKVIATQGKASPDEIKEIIEQEITIYKEYLATCPLLDRAKLARISSVKKKQRGVIENAVANVFQKLPISKTAKADLITLVAETSCRKVFHSDSGVVIAGFGQKDIFPKLASMTFGGILDDLLRYEISKNYVISRDNRALIVPFAQSEMVRTFMEGIDPSCQRVINSYLETILQQYPVDVVNVVPSISIRKKAQLVKRLQGAGRTMLKDFREKLDAYQDDRHVQPVISAIDVLPKDLLAEVAESLVNLTSFKRRISMDSAETVGGPIDVAVISKGDGFIWIKRKHYFKSELNPQFLLTQVGGSDETAAKP